MAPRSLSSVGPKRGSLQKRDVAMVVQTYSSSNHFSECLHLTIYRKPSEGARLCDEKDCLSSLPLELLVMIVSHVPLESYVDIVQTSSPLRQLVKMNGARLCNAIIGNRFSLEASMIPSARINSWIVPTHPDLDALERYLLDKKKYIDDAMAGTSAEQESSTRDLQIKLSRPGPQYLMWLQRGKIFSRRTPADTEEKVPSLNRREVVEFLKLLNCELTTTAEEEVTPREL